jgi:hypothetical protein
MAARGVMAIVRVSAMAQVENAGALRAMAKAADLPVMVPAAPVAMTVAAIRAEIRAANANGRMMLLNSVLSLPRRFSRTIRSLKFSAAR